MLLDDIKTIIAAVPGAQLKEKNASYSFESVVAERKTFLSTKKLTYKASFRIDDTARILSFSEMLKESGSGISSSGADGDISPGFGFKAETYSVGMGPRKGNITEQSTLFSKQYNYSFDFSKIRQAMEAAAAKSGYTFSYHLTQSGL